MLKRKILIMGLPGSGKTTLAEKLVPKLNAAWFNADAVRQDIYSELGFDPGDRITHATRMGKLCDWAKMGGCYVIADFICPMPIKANLYFSRRSERLSSVPNMG